MPSTYGNCYIFIASIYAINYNDFIFVIFNRIYQNVGYISATYSAKL